MGHGQKNTNRGEAISRNTQRVRKLAEKHKELAELFKKVRTELKDDIGGIISDVEAEYEAIDARIENLANIVAFNALPFWKRWWFRLDQWWKKRAFYAWVKGLADEPPQMDHELEVVDAKEEEAQVAADAEPPSSDSGPEDAGAEEENGGPGQDENRVS